MTLTPQQRDAIRKTLEAAALAWKRGWSIDYVLDAIEQTLADDADA